MVKNILYCVGVTVIAAFLISMPLYFGAPFLALAQMDPANIRTDYPVCGNGLIEEFELCDDGNAYILDGCSGCMVDRRYACIGEPSLCIRPRR